MKRILLLAGLLSAGMAASSTGAQAQTPPSVTTSPPVDGMVWELQTLTDGSGRATTLKQGLSNPTMQFDGRAATGSTYRAGYASRADLLRFGPAATTRRACLPQIANLERQFLNLLRGTNRYTVAENVLTLYSGADGRLVFQKRSGAKPAQPPTSQMQPGEAPVPFGQMQLVQVQPSAQPSARPLQPPVRNAPSGNPLASAATIFDRANASDLFPDASNLGPDEDLLIVGPIQADCAGAVPQRCLLVKHPGEAAWSLFYSQIEGFRFQPGVISLLRVGVERVARPAEGGSNVRYRLVRVLGTQNIH